MGLGPASLRSDQDCPASPEQCPPCAGIGVRLRRNMHERSLSEVFWVNRCIPNDCPDEILHGRDLL
jgi:hypothetical protein